MTPRTLHRLVLALALLCMPASARGATTRYGVALGSGLALHPTGQPGIGGGAFSLTRDLEGGPPAVLHLRGEVLALWSGDGSFVLPELSADLGVAAGPLELWLSGGLQLFGFVWRADTTLFTTFGLVGGAGLGVRITDSLRLELRGIVSWLPESSAARLTEPPVAEADTPTLLFVNGLLGLSIRHRAL